MFVKLSYKNLFININLCSTIFVENCEIHCFYPNSIDGGFHTFGTYETDEIANEVLSDMMISFNNGDYVFAIPYYLDIHCKGCEYYNNERKICSLNQCVYH